MKKRMAIAVMAAPAVLAALALSWPVNPKNRENILPVQADPPAQAETTPAEAAPEKRIVLGILRPDGEKHDAEFQTSGQADIYRRAGFDPALFNYHEFVSGAPNSSQLRQLLRQYHTVQLTPCTSGIKAFDAAAQNRARAAAAALAGYVEKGGGLVISPQPVRYPGAPDELFWNAVFAPFGVEIARAGLVDRGAVETAVIKPGTAAEFFYVPAPGDHPILKDVGGLWLPVESIHRSPGVLSLAYSPEWEPLIVGGDGVRRYVNNDGNELTGEETPEQEKNPVIAAVRSFGKGFVVSLPVCHVHDGLNLGNPNWGHVVESEGAGGKPSGGMAFLFNAFRFTAQNALGEPSLGIYRARPAAPVAFPAAVSLDSAPIPPNSGAAARGILGAHTSHSDGTGTVAEYVAAAKAAGLSFIVFADPLELLTEGKLNALKDDCAAATEDGFLALPGVEFTDAAGIRWFAFGRKLVWPPPTVTQQNRTVAQWDGKIMHQYGAYSISTDLSSSAVIDYNDLRKAGARPENLWWFFKSAIRSYDNQQLIADNFRDYLWSLRDLRYLTPITFDRIKSPSSVAASAAAASTLMNDLARADKALDARANSMQAALNANQQVVFGGDIRFNRYNAAIRNGPQSVRGVHRVRVAFDVESPHGIVEALIHDADQGVVRRFDGGGRNRLEVEFEAVRDRQRYFVAEAVDAAGNRAVTTYYFVYEYKQGLFRCGDNLNILGPLGYYWHPDRHQTLPLIKDFRNAELYSVFGWDRGGADTPKPDSLMPNLINIKGLGAYPQKSGEYMFGTRMDVVHAGNNIQVVDMLMDELHETWGNERAVSPAQSSVSRKVADNEYFTRRHRMYSPRDRQEHYIAWDHRRLRESLRDYDGSLQFHEGEITFKKDVTLSGAVPIPLAVTYLWRESLKFDTTFVVREAGEEPSIRFGTGGEPLRAGGKLAPGGFAAQMSSPIGYIGVFPAKGDDWVYAGVFPGRLTIGLGGDGREIKAGATLRYAYAGAAVINPKPNAERLEFLSGALNLGGGSGGYPIEMKRGALVDATFFHSVEAEDGAARFVLGPLKGLGIDLPIRVTGLEDNGCIWVYSTHRPFYRPIGAGTDGVAYFQEPIDSQNDIWVGNVFRADHPELKLTLVAEGLTKGNAPFLEIHNPAREAVTVRVASPDGTPRFGGTAFTATIPAGSSVRRTLAETE